MKAVKIILGILLMIASFYCVAFPGAGTVTLIWILAIAMLVSGLIGIINFILDKKAAKEASKKGIPYAGMGVGGLVAGIVAVVLSIIFMTTKGGATLFTSIIFIAFCLWIIISGISDIMLAVSLKNVKGSSWVALLILGILLAILGIFTIVNIYFGLFALGTLFGLSMLMFSVSLLCSVGDGE